MHLRFRYAALLILLLIGAVFAPGLSAQSNIENIVITEVDASGFPQVVVRFRALDAAGFPVTNIQTGLFTVQEGSSTITPENLKEAEEGLCVQFMVEAGVWLFGPSWQNAQAVITDFAQTTPWMKEDMDYVALTMMEATGPRQLLGFTGDSEALVTAVANYTPPRGADISRPIPALEEKVEELAINPPTACKDNRPKFIVYLSSGMESGTGQVSALAAQAKAAGIPIYTVLLGNRDGQPLETLAQESGGKYVQYTNRNSLASFYTQMTEYRRHYDLSYRSQVNESGTQPVKLIANVGGSGGTKTSETASYTVTVDRPRVLITAPTAGTAITRSAAEYTDNLTTLTPTSYTVLAHVIFPDDHIRRLRQATLLVNGAVAQTLTNPNPNENMELLWNLQNIHKEDAFSLEVEILDELGLVSKSQAVAANVVISLPPKPPPGTTGTPTPNATVTITATPVPTSIPTPCPYPETVCTITGAVSSNPTSFVSLGIALFSLVFAGMVWINRDKAPVRAVTDTVRRGVDAMTKRYLGPTEARAYLVVLEGDVNVGKTLEIYGDTPIGRSRQTAELIFQQYDDNSPISRLHCTITDEEDHFTIKDEDSANGTFLNGAKLSPLTPEVLHDGDEIELGRVERGGVRLLFQMAASGGDDAQVGRVTKKTRSTATPPTAEDEDEQTTNKPVKPRF